jgi:zinc transport system ATP-binding protein
MNLVELKNVSLKIKNNKIISDISLQLKKGQITTLIGPNGGGKTTIAKIVLGLIKPSEGSLAIANQIRFGYMPQKINLDQSIPITAKDFVTLNQKKFIDENIFQQLISRLNIGKYFNKPLCNLSGGQLQKILFLRSIINNPDVIVLDEPTQYMDITAIAEFYHILDEIRQTKNCSILLISHDLNLVMQKTDHVICINHHICCEGNVKSINENPNYHKLFGLKPLNTQDHKLEDEITIYQHHHNHHH